MKNLPHLIVERGSRVRRIAEEIAEICKLDSQIAEKRVGLSREDSDALDTEIDQQDDKLIRALTVADQL
jgi:hypothetical protein